MPSFATEVKNELARLMYDNNCCQRAELAALLRMGASMTLGFGRTIGISFVTENAAVARKILNLVKLVSEGNVGMEVSVRRHRRLNKSNSYHLRAAPSAQVKQLLTELGLMKGDSFNVGSDGDLLRKGCCRAAYLRGAFLGGGSINRPEAGSHFEFVTGSYAFAATLVSILKKMGMPAGIMERKSGYVVYVKESESIMDLMGIMEAEASLEEFEGAKNLKELRNQVNRIVNCETANLQKTVKAAYKQVAAVQLLKEQGIFDGLPEGLKEAGNARIENPESSLKELSELLGVGRSGINHRLRRLEQLAKECKGDHEA